DKRELNNEIERNKRSSNGIRNLLDKLEYNGIYDVGYNCPSGNEEKKDDSIKLVYDRRKLDQAKEKRVENIPVVFNNRSEMTSDKNGDSNETNNCKSGRDERVCVGTTKDEKEVLEGEKWLCNMDLMMMDYVMKI
ncbi:1610_t:CDS:1, partial [Gigaspora rosea]